MSVRRLVLAWLIAGLAGSGCKDKAEDKAAPAAAPASQAESSPPVLTERGQRPELMHDGLPARVMDMRVRAKPISEGVVPGADGWKAGGDWRVFELGFRRGGLKAELAILIPSEPAGAPVAGRGRLRWLAGDPGPFLSALGFVLGAGVKAIESRRGQPVGFELQVLTVSGKDTGGTAFELTGGEWILCRATVLDPVASRFDLRFLPARGLLRIVPIQDEPVDPVMHLFSLALL